jgi:hypothetical protein
MEQCKTGGVQEIYLSILSSQYNPGDLKKVDGKLKVKRKYGKHKREKLPMNEWKWVKF